MAAEDDYPITYEDGDMCIANAPVLRVFRANDFPCRDTDVSDHDHQRELDRLARHLCELAEAQRLLKRSPHFAVLMEVGDERHRQVGGEGWSPAHDDKHTGFELARAAACYVLVAGNSDLWRKNYSGPPLRWPWDRRWWKPTSRRRDLLKAAALIIAEIERLDRAANG